LKALDFTSQILKMISNQLAGKITGMDFSSTQKNGRGFAAG